MEDRVCIFIDGSNLYHALREGMGRTDLNFVEFARKLAAGRPVFRIYYYNALQDPARNPDSAREQQEFLAMLRTSPYLEVRLGTLKTTGGVTVEKGVDVMLATDVVHYAFENIYDTAIIVSGDADYAYALQLVKNKGKHVEVAYFETNISRELLELADVRHFIDRKFLEGLWTGRRIRAAAGGMRRRARLMATPAAEPLPAGEAPEAALPTPEALPSAAGLPEAEAAPAPRRRRRRRRPAGAGAGAPAAAPEAETAAPAPPPTVQPVEAPAVAEAASAGDGAVPAAPTVRRRRRRGGRGRGRGSAVTPAAGDGAAPPEASQPALGREATQSLPAVPAELPPELPGPVSEPLPAAAAPPARRRGRARTEARDAAAPPPAEGEPPAPVPPAPTPRRARRTRTAAGPEPAAGAEPAAGSEQPVAAAEPPQRTRARRPAATPEAPTEAETPAPRRRSPRRTTPAGGPAPGEAPDA